jgi:glucose/arabinose dehydrogenase
LSNTHYSASRAGIGGILRRILRSAGLLIVAAFIASAFAWTVHAQTTRSIPRPPAQQPGAPPAGSAAPDGYSPIPEWAGQTRAPRVSVSVPYTAEVVSTGIANGYSIEFMPDGRILLVERPGRLKIIDRSGQISTPVAGLPPMYAGGPQGLVGAIADRDFATNHIVYLAYTAANPNASSPPAPSQVEGPPRLAGVLTIARAQLSADSTRLEDVRVLLNAEGIGGRMIQARDGTLVITSSIPAGVGILSEDWPQPQQLDSLMGKVLRINTDGTVPKDNPFVGRPNVRPEIFALGIRDDQGLAFHPRTGRLWASEHGPRGGDEINVIQKGKNYGFPVIGYGHDYDGNAINHDRTSQAGMEQPVYFWTPDIAPGGISFYSGKLFPAWNGDLFVAALAGKHLARLVLQGERVIGEERLLTELDTRIRDVKEGPDGALYVLTDRDGGKLLRLVPAKQSSAKGHDQ